MNRFIKLLKLELKQAIGSLPRILLGSGVLLAVVTAILFCGQHLLYQKSTINKARIAFVIEDDSAFVSTAIGLAATQSSSTSATCEFLFLEADEAQAQLDAGNLIAVATVPKGFIHSISDGSNMHISIAFASDIGYEAVVFKEIATAATQILGAAQAGNYAARDFYHAYDAGGSHLGDAYNRLQTAYILLALKRESLFNNQIVTATSGLSVTHFFLAGSIVLFLLLWGIPCIRYLTRYPKSFTTMLRRQGTGIIACVGSKYLGLVALFLVLTLCLVPVICAFQVPLLALLCTLPFLVFTASALLLLLFECTDGGIETILLILFTAFILCIISGCLIPSAFLPDMLNKISYLFPTTYMRLALTDAIGGSISLINVLAMLGFSTLFFAVTCGLRYLQIHGHSRKD